MIKTQSDDPNVGAAAMEASKLIEQVLGELPKAEEFDYGGHELHLGEYGVCARCTGSIAEAQQAREALLDKAESVEDETVKEHLVVAAELFRLEAEAAQIRAQLHNGQNSEPILNQILGYIHNRSIHDSYDHSHGQGGN